MSLLSLFTTKLIVNRFTLYPIVFDKGSTTGVIGGAEKANSSGPLELTPDFFSWDSVQSVSITTKVLSSNPVHGKVYLIQHYVIKFVSDLRQVCGSGFVDQ